MSLSYAEHQEKISKVFDDAFLPVSSRDQKLLELGCGVGALTRKVASMAPTVSITAIDINQSLIDIAISMSDEPPFKNVNFLQADVKALNKLSQDFDGVYCRFLLEEFTEPSLVIKSMCEAVKPGGWVCVYERLNRYCSTFPNSKAIADVWDGIYGFYQSTYGASPNAGEDLVSHFQKADLKNISVQGFSRILSKEKNADLFSWYSESALNVVGQMKDNLIKSGGVAETTIKTATDDYKSILTSSTSFVLETTIAVSGTK